MRNTYTYNDLDWAHAHDGCSGTSGTTFAVPLKDNPSIQICVKKVDLTKEYAWLLSYFLVYIFYYRDTDIRQLDNETELLSRLDQTSNFVIKYYGHDSDSCNYYIFMEYAALKDFRTLLEPELSYSEDEIWNHLTSIALGLNSLITLLVLFNIHLNVLFY